MRRKSVRRTSVIVLVSAILLSGLNLVGAGTASAGTTKLTKSDALQCTLDVPGVGRISTISSMSVTFDIPDTVIAGVPTAPIPFTGTADPGFTLDKTSPLRKAVLDAGATTVDVDVAIPVSYYTMAPYTPETSPRWSKTGIPLDDASLSVTGSGTLPPLRYERPGRQNGLYYASSFSVTATPRKADGSVTSLGRIGGTCLTQPWFQLWNSFDVIPRVAHVDLPVTAKTRLARPAADVDLGPGTLSLDRDVVTDEVTGKLDLPGPGPVKFTLSGAIPVTATVRLTPGALTGVMKDAVATMTAPAKLGVSDLAVFGLPLLKDRATCQANTVLDLTATGFGSPPFLVTGSYPLTSFTGCGTATPIVSALFEGRSNTLTATYTGQ